MKTYKVTEEQMILIGSNLLTNLNYNIAELKKANELTIPCDQLNQYYQSRINEIHDLADSLKFNIA